MKTARPIVLVVIVVCLFGLTACNQYVGRFEKSPEFTSAVEKIGFGKAVILNEEKLTENFFSKLSCDQWMKIYNASTKDSPIEKRAMETAVDKSPVISTTLALYVYFPVGSAGEALAEKKALTQASSQAEWSVLFNIARRGSVAKNTAFDKISESCSTFDEWRTVWKLTESGSKFEEKAIEKMTDTANGVSEWTIIFMLAPSGSPIERLAMNRLLAAGLSELPSRSDSNLRLGKQL